MRFSDLLFAMRIATALNWLFTIIFILMSLYGPRPQPNNSSTTISIYSNSTDYWDVKNLFTQMEEEDRGRRVLEDGSPRGLEYDFYRHSCPRAEEIIREAVRDMYRVKYSVAPALLRLAFHDCFIEGCDASILLDEVEGMVTEKNSPPNEGLRGFPIVDAIKSELERECPGVVSCADIIVLAARGGVVLAGGPFYPLYTGRRDGIHSFRDFATEGLPSPHDDLSDILAVFASNGFDERETVSLLGAHSIGVIHCKFFEKRLYNFSGTNKPDPSLDAGFLNLMRSKCMNTSMEAPASSPFHASPSPAPSTFSGGPKTSTAPTPSTSSGGPRTSAASAPSFSGSPTSSSENQRRESSAPLSAAPLNSFKGPQPSSSSAAPFHYFKRPRSSSSSVAPSGHFFGSLLSSLEEPGVNMAYEGPGVDFGALYYRSLLEGKGILYADQQLMASDHTGFWVRAYASDVSLFRKDFAMSMMKLSNLRVLTGSAGQIRHNCSKVV